MGVSSEILDHSMASGSKMLASYLNNRRGIGIDMGHCQLTIDRLRQIDILAERGLNEEENHS